MNTSKLYEALAELEAQQKTFAEAIASLRKILSPLEEQAPVTSKIAEDASRSYIDDAEAILQEHGRPIHAKDLTAKISALRGSPVPRASVESSMIRHIAKAKQPRLAKFGKSTFGLPAWKPSLLAQMAS